MSVLGWLFGSKRYLSQLPDRVWLSHEGLRQGFPNVLKDASERKSLTVVTTHFPSLLADAGEFLRGRIDFVEVKYAEQWAAACKPAAPGAAPVVLIPAELLRGVGLPTLPAGLEFVRIFVCGRHFLREKDDAIADFGERFAHAGEIAFHVSLDDPLLRVYLADAVRSLLRTTAGAGEEPWIESSMVSRSIHKAQNTLQSKFISRHDAASPEEWLAKNTC